MIFRNGLISLLNFIRIIVPRTDNNQDTHYNPKEIKGLLDIYENNNLKGTILVISQSTVIPHSMWLKVFRKAISITTQINDAAILAPCSNHDRSWFVVGKAWQIPTMKEVYANISNIDALFIDNSYYFRLMPCYLIYSKLVRTGGVIAFANSFSPHSKYQIVTKFLNDLRSGYVDGYKHNIHNIQIGGNGISYEIKRETKETNTYNSPNEYSYYSNKKILHDAWILICFFVSFFKWINKKEIDKFLHK